MDPTICPKCEKDLVLPKTLPCLHTFCLSCLNGITGDLVCFTCKDPFSAPSGGDLSSLPTFPLVAALVGQKTSAPKDINNVKCTMCEEEERATSFCSICSEYYCVRCSAFHKKSKVLSSHELVPIEEHLNAPKTRVLRCSLHPGQDVDVYCRKCEVAVCPRCAVIDHDGHDLGKVSEGGDKIAAALKESIPKLEKAREGFEKAQEEIAPLLKQIEENEEKETQAAKKEFDDIRNTLNQREQQILALIKQIADHKRNTLLNQLDTLAFASSGHHISLHLAQLTLEHGTQQEILASARSLLDRIQTLEKRHVELEALENEVVEFVNSGAHEARQLLSSVGDVNGEQAVAERSYVRKEGLRQWYDLGERVKVEAVGVSKEGKEIARSGGGFWMEVTGPGGNQVAKVPLRSAKEGGVAGEFGAEEEGVYQLRVTLFGKVIKDGEQQVQVSTTSSEHSSVEWKLEEKGDVILTVTSCKRSGERTGKGGEQFEVKVGEEGKELQPSAAVDNGDGTYTARFQATRMWKASVTFKGEHIKNSPCWALSSLFSSPKRYELLYDAKQDGYSNQTFHQKCDHVEGTLTIVTLTNGRVFGGYQAGNWQGGGNYKQAPNNDAFLFALTGEGVQRYRLKQGQEGMAVNCYPGYGPTFGGGHDLYLDLNSPASSNSNAPYSYEVPSNTTLAGSQTNWSFGNVEVFHVVNA